MTISYKAILTCGGSSIDISTGRYYLKEFSPPVSNVYPITTEGLLGNRYGGEAVVDYKGENFEFTFAFVCLGVTEKEVAAGIDAVDNMVAMAGDEMIPLYLQFAPSNYVPYPPTWGQRGWKQLEIVYGQVMRTEHYGIANLREKEQTAYIKVFCKPVVLGLPQSILFAYNGPVVMNSIGNSSKQVYSITIGQANTANQLKNTSFDRTGDFDNQWTTEASLIAAANTLPEYIAFGSNSLKIANTTTTEKDFYQTLTLTASTDYCVSWYVKKLDKSAVTASDVKVCWNGTGQTSTYDSLGDGWYRVWYTANTGGSTSFAVGLSVQPGATVFADGALCVSGVTFPTMYFNGDWVGCDFSGTRQETTSTRNVPVVFSYGGVDGSSGTICIAYKTLTSNTWATNQQLFFIGQASGTDVRAYFNATDDKFYFHRTDGAWSISSAAQTFARGDLIILHFVWSRGSVAIYKNGVSIASGSTYYPPDTATPPLLISDSTEPLMADIYDFTVWMQPFSAQETLDDYTNIYQALIDGIPIQSIPVVYTKSVRLLKGYDNSLLEDMMVAYNIPGNLPANTYLSIYCANVITSIVIGQLRSRLYVGYNGHKDTVLYEDLGGTVDTSAIGNAKKLVTVGTTQVAITTAMQIVDMPEQLFGNNAWILFRAIEVSGSGTGLQAAAQIAAGGAGTIGAYSTIQANTTNTLWFIVGPIFIPEWNKAMYNMKNVAYSGAVPNVDITLFLKRLSGSSYDVYVDYARVVLQNLSLLETGVENQYIVFNGSSIIGLDSSASPQSWSQLRGAPLEFHPGVYNHTLMTIIGGYGGVKNAIVQDIELKNSFIVPRWSLL